MSAPRLARHFEQLAGAPSGVAQLRELIVALAVRGTLVPQQDADGYASRLLEESRAQVRAKMHEGKAKKEKPAADVDAAETPFEIPDTWQWCRLTDTGEFINGLAFKPTDWAPDGLPIIRIQNLSGRNQEFNRTKGSFHPSVIVRSGDILVSWSATLDAFVWQGETGVLNQHIFRVEPAPCVDRGFLYWLLKWAIRDLAESEHAHGLVMSHINRGPFLAKPIALPPLAEQARIVARVDELMQLCDALETKGRLEAQQHARLLETLLGTLTESTTPEELAANWQRVAEHFDLLMYRPEAVDVLEQTVLQLAVRGLLVPQDPSDEPASSLLQRIAATKERLVSLGRVRRERPMQPIENDVEQFDLPAGWAWVRLQEAYDVRDGTHDTPKYHETGVPLVTSKNLSSGRLDLTDVKLISTADHEAISARSKVDRHDILFAMIGSIGNPVIVDTDVEFSIKNVALFKHYSLSLSSPEFLLLSLTVAADRMSAQAAGGVQSFISLGQIRSTTIALPPLAEQARIVARVTELRRLCADLRQRLAASQATQSRLAEALVEAATA
ncbi:MAG: restriction endonuclease subunit S [bacterium]